MAKRAVTQKVVSTPREEEVAVGYERVVENEYHVRVALRVLAPDIQGAMQLVDSAIDASRSQLEIAEVEFRKAPHDKPW